MASHICHMNSPVDQSGQPFFCVEIEKKNSLTAALRLKFRFSRWKILEFITLD